MLACLFCDPSARIHLRELARRTGYSAPMVAKEAARLVAAKVVLERDEGNARVFQANMRSPLAADIRRIAVPPGAHPRRGRQARGARVEHRRPRSLEEAARWGAAAGRRDALLREFCDEFYSARSDDTRAGMLAGEPPFEPRDERANAYYAAVAEHLALSNGLPIPGWALDPRRFLGRPFFPAGLESLKSTVLVESPPAFRRRMIFVGADPLYRPRRGPAARP